LTTDLELVAYAGGGSHTVLQKYETSSDLIIHKMPRYGNYHIESTNHLLFMEIDIPDMTWPGECWEVKKILVVMHKNNIGRILRDNTPRLENPRKRARDFLADLAMDLTFHTAFGRYSDSKLFGRLSIPALGTVTASRVPNLPAPFNFYVNFSLPKPLDTDWKSTSDFDVGVSNLPPLDGFLALSMRGNDYVALYESEISGNSTDDEVVQRIRVGLDVHKIAVMTNINEQLRDMGKRVRVEAKIDIELTSRKGNVVLTALNFSVPLKTLNEWLNTNFSECEIITINCCKSTKTCM